jgi:hypothetical protein
MSRRMGNGAQAGKFLTLKKSAHDRACNALTERDV